MGGGGKPGEEHSTRETVPNLLHGCVGVTGHKDCAAGRPWSAILPPVLEEAFQAPKHQQHQARHLQLQATVWKLLSLVTA